MSTPAKLDECVERLLDERAKLQEALASRETLHEEIEHAVRARGVLDGQDDDTLLHGISRKLYEETIECTDAIKAYFCGFCTLQETRNELADVYVVVARAERLIERMSGEPFDVALAALEKARRDVARGTD